MTAEEALREKETLDLHPERKTETGKGTEKEKETPDHLYKKRILRHHQDIENQCHHVTSPRLVLIALLHEAKIKI